MFLKKILLSAIIFTISGSFVNTASALSADDLFKQGTILNKQNKYKQAFPYFTQAAEKGHDHAAYSLSIMYKFGQGVDVDKAMSIKWLKKGAELGSMVAQHFLGHAYQSGDGVKKNVPLSLSWYLKAAKQNETESMYHYAEALHSGKYIKQDAGEADKWFKKVKPLLLDKAKNGDMRSAHRFYVMHNKGYGIEENKKIAYEGFKYLAEKNHPDSQYELGWFYYLGRYIEKDLPQARLLWTMAAEAGHSGAKHFLKKQGWN